MLKRMHKDGDEIGNHSWSHPDFTKLKPKQIKQQISRTQAVVAATGAPAPTLFRPPYAAVNKKVQTNVPLTIMLWDEDPRDWATDSAKKVAKSVIKQAQPGGIVDLHDLDPSTAKAVPAILKNLHKQHYHLVTISYLLNLHKAHPGKVYDYHTLVQTSAGKLDQ
jgi:peptidoglycan/xylan/chitin deacetylase (PgdA/CDA1 family)